MPVDPGPCAWALPDPRDAEPGEDLVGIGADLEPATLVAAYASGIFPMEIDDAAGQRHLGWWSPDPRGVLPLDGLRVSRSLARSMRRYALTVDRDFRAVITACATVPRDRGWITPAFVEAYCALHELGWAHSVEAWHGDRLVGGLYGVEVGGLFAGESMFHVERDASKAALAHLVGALGAAGGDRLLDVQWRTDHLASLGAIEIPRARYLERLGQALELQPCLGS